jgi:hypothetical protein
VRIVAETSEIIAKIIDENIKVLDFMVLSKTSLAVNTVIISAESL